MTQPTDYVILGWKNRSAIFEHVKVWEDANGPVPKGYNVHHLDGNTKNNDLRNLQLLKSGEHSVIHKLKWVQVGNEWMQRCSVCGELKPLSQFRQKARKYGLLYPYCLPCHNQKMRLYVRNPR